MFKLGLLLTLATFAYSQDATDTCLAETNLTDFGFTAATMEAVESPTYCTDVYNSPGRCITADTIKAIIEKKQTNATTYNEGYLQIDKDYNTFFGNIGAKITELWNDVLKKEGEKTWKDQMAEVTKNAEDNADKCFKTYNQISHGVACFLSSGSAGQGTTVSGKTVTIKATDSIQQVVDDCMNIVSTICMFFKGGEEAKLDTAQTDSQKALCTEHNNYKQCLSEGGNETSCMTTARKEALFNEIYSFTSNKWMPDPTKVQGVTDKILEWFDGAKEKVFSWFKPTEETSTDTSTETTTRILEETATVEFSFSAEGKDLWTIGGKSGVIIISVSNLKWGIIATLIAMFLRF